MDTVSYTHLDVYKRQKDRFAIDETDFPRINHDWIISAYTEAAGKA